VAQWAGANKSAGFLGGSGELAGMGGVYHVHLDALDSQTTHWRKGQGLLRGLQSYPITGGLHLAYLGYINQLSTTHTRIIPAPTAVNARPPRQHRLLIGMGEARMAHNPVPRAVGLIGASCQTQAWSVVRPAR
jgi:hypothetical protein